MLDGPRSVRASPKLEKIFRTETAEGHLEELEPDRCRVGGRDEPSFETRPQVSVGKGEAKVQEERGGQDVEDRPERERARVLGELPTGKRARKSTGDHQDAQSAVRPAHPRDQAGGQEGDADPFEQEHAQTVRALACQGKANRGGSREGAQQDDPKDAGAHSDGRGRCQI